MKGTAGLILLGLAGTAVLVGRMKAAALPAMTSAVIQAPIEAGLPGPCGEAAAPAPGPDLVACEIGASGGTDFAEYVTFEGLSGYAFGTTACNNGDTLLYWIDEEPEANRHPVIALNLYRLMDGRFEQIGMSWVKHGFCAGDSPTCAPCTPDAPCETLQIGCSDTYHSTLNGLSQFLGPRSEVDAATGVFRFPHAAATGVNAGRMLVRIEDVTPSLNPGATYYGETQFVTPDDAGTTNAYNNNTWRAVTVGTLNFGTWDLAFTGLSMQQEPAIRAWQDADPGVTLVNVDVDGDGRFILGHAVTNNGDGTWHYEYALFNMTSHRSAREFAVPVAAELSVTGIGFSDVTYRFGDGVGGIDYDGTDWAVTVGGDLLGWSTDTEAANPNANALRWSTLYSFRFDASSPPVAATATIGLFRAGTPAQVTVPVAGPDPCPWDLDGGGVGVTDLLLLLGAWGTPVAGPPDFDGDGTVGVIDLLAMLAHWGGC